MAWHQRRVWPYLGRGTQTKGAGVMCGIMAYVGTQDAVPLVLEGLRRLEYRGYDSAGIAVLVERQEGLAGADTGGHDGTPLPANAFDHALNGGAHNGGA